MYHSCRRPDPFPLADFAALLDRNPQIAHVELSNYGEMFLNPHLADILACVGN
jgi:hypothetical protein